MICLRSPARSAWLAARRSRRSDHRDAAFCFTLCNRHWPGTTRTLPPICMALPVSPHPCPGTQIGLICGGSQYAIGFAEPRSGARPHGSWRLTWQMSRTRPGGRPAASGHDRQSQQGQRRQVTLGHEGGGRRQEGQGDGEGRPREEEGVARDGQQHQQPPASEDASAIAVQITPSTANITAGGTGRGLSTTARNPS
jgi:hypothetical protein